MIAGGGGGILSVCGSKKDFTPNPDKLKNQGRDIFLGIGVYLFLKIFVCLWQF